MSQEKWFIFIILLFIVPTSLSYLFPFVSVETWSDGYLFGKELVILLFVCVVGKCFVVFYVFSFPPAVYVGTLNLIASIPGPSVLILFYMGKSENYGFFENYCSLRPEK